MEKEKTKESTKPVKKISNISIVILTVIISLLAVATGYLIFDRCIRTRMNACVTTTTTTTPAKKEYKVSDYVAINYVVNEYKEMFENYDVYKATFYNLPDNVTSSFLEKQQEALTLSRNVGQSTYDELMNSSEDDENYHPETFTMYTSANIKDNILYVYQVVYHPNAELTYYQYNYLCVNLDTKEKLDLKSYLELKGYDLSKAANKLYDKFFNEMGTLYILGKDGDFTGEVVTRKFFEEQRAVNVAKIVKALEKKNINTVVLDETYSTPVESIRLIISQLVPILNWGQPTDTHYLYSIIPLEK